MKIKVKFFKELTTSFLFSRFLVASALFSGYVTHANAHYRKFTIKYDVKLFYERSHFEDVKLYGKKLLVSLPCPIF
jgi:hypothetical protein